MTNGDYILKYNIYYNTKIKFHDKDFYLLNNIIGTVLYIDTILLQFLLKIKDDDCNTQVYKYELKIANKCLENQKKLTLVKPSDSGRQLISIITY